jgi:hypothetical protein
MPLAALRENRHDWAAIAFARLDLSSSESTTHPHQDRPALQKLHYQVINHRNYLLESPTLSGQIKITRDVDCDIIQEVRRRAEVRVPP